MIKALIFSFEERRDSCGLLGHTSITTHFILEIFGGGYDHIFGFLQIES